jgi:geranylgeranyl diphosphate synthase, type I
MTLEELKEEIWSVQRVWLEELVELERASGSKDLADAVWHQVSSEGKRLRALLPVAVARALKPGLQAGSRTWERAAWAGLAAEIVHSASLVHDDIMDGDRMRRNVESVWARFGTPQAINAGDILFYLAEEAVARCPASDTGRVRLAGELSLAMRRLIHGQAAEIELRKRNRLPDMKTYQMMVTGKTGALFGFCMASGALACDVERDRVAALRNLGVDLGEAFQIQDDLLDILGDKGRGAQAQDLWEGKPSWLVASCAATLGPTEADKLRDTLYLPRDEKSEEQIAWLRASIEASGAPSAGLEELEALRERISAGSASLGEDVQGLVKRLLGWFYRPLSGIKPPSSSP